MFLLKRLTNRSLFSLTQSSSTSPYQRSISSIYPLTDSHAHGHPTNPRNVRVSVWWDLNTCTVPVGANAFRLAQTINAALNASGIKGPIQITAFADVSRLSKTNHWAMSNSGIFINNTGGKKCSTDELRTYLNEWVLKNPPPGHMFLISDDIKLEDILCRGREEKYNMLLSSNKSSGLITYASAFWLWDDLVGVEKDMKWCDENFWRDLKTMLNGDIGSYIIRQSSSRENLSYYLHKYGPSVLKSVPKSDVLYMVGMLVSRKKLVHETGYLINPFNHPDKVKKSKEDQKLEKIKNLENINEEQKIQICQLSAKIEKLQSQLEALKNINEEQKSQLEALK